MRPKCNQENTLNEVKRWCEKSPYIRFSFRVSFLVILNRLSFSEDKELISIKLLTNIDILVGEKESLDVRNMLGSDSHHFCISFYNGHYLCGRCKLSRSHRECGDCGGVSIPKLLHCANSGKEVFHLGHSVYQVCSEEVQYLIKSSSFTLLRAHTRSLEQKYSDC